MQGPYLVKYCFKEPIDHKTVTYIASALQEAAKASSQDLLLLILETVEYFKSLPEPFYECMVKQP